METHLSTCEIYDCNDCYIKVKQIGEMKTHMEDKHRDDEVQFTHWKVNRNDAEEIDQKEHWNYATFPGSFSRK